MPTQTYDFIVVGSGAAGLLAALRAHDHGLSACVIEKTSRYGGTSAVSGGGIWVPDNADIQDEDTAAQALTYLRACTKGAASDAALAAYIAAAPRMARYVSEKLGVKLTSIRPLPDYLSRLPGAARGRAMAPADMDGKALGDDYFSLREPYSYLLLMNRLSINNFEAGVLGAKAPGYQKLLLRLLASYWLDFAWRRRTRRDRRLCNGQALVGGLRRAMLERKIPLFLNTRLETLMVGAERRVTGLRASRNSAVLEFGARRGVLLAAGGFESNPVLRAQYLDTPCQDSATAAPAGINTGDALRAGLAAGARLSGMNLLWKAPALRVPVANQSNAAVVQPFFWDRAAPGSLCVNRLGRRFVDESVSYDEFGAAMLADAAQSDARPMCWMIFDAACRRRSLIGPLLPGELKPDRKLPPEWLDTLFYRADSIAALAEKIGLPAAALQETVARFNHAALAGQDPEFDRGGSAYDQFWGNPAIKPNGALAALNTAPFYAVNLEFGDIGTKGGLAIDTQGRVLGENGPIPGLYAAGNCAAPIFGDAYPGAGGTLGPAMTMAMLAAEHVAATPA